MNSLETSVQEILLTKDDLKNEDLAKTHNKQPDCEEISEKAPKMVSYMKLENAIKGLSNSDLQNPQWRETLFVLKDLQFEHTKIEEAYRKEWNAMKLRYLAQFQPLYEQRKEILTGRSQDSDETTVVKEDIAPESISDQPPENIEESGTKNLPKFWLKAMKNHPLLEEMIEECDPPILEYLEDIRFSWVDPNDQTSFRLEFFFATNPYFKNKILTKTYYLEPSEDDDEESVLTRTVGTEIQWYPGNNITERTVVRRQRNRRTNQTRVIHEQVKINSFFNFFNTYEIPNEDQLDGMAEQDVSELEMIVEAEFEVGAVLRDKIIPRALGWYLGIEHDDLQSEDVDMDDFEEDEEENDESSASSEEKE